MNWQGDFHPIEGQIICRYKQHTRVDKQSFHKCQRCNDSIKQLLHIRHRLIYYVELTQSQTAGSIGFTLRDYRCCLSRGAFNPVPMHMMSVNISNCHSADLCCHYFYPGNYYSLKGSFLKSFCINLWMIDQQFLQLIWRQRSWHFSHRTHLSVQKPEIRAVRQMWCKDTKAWWTTASQHLFIEDISFVVI